MLHINKIVKLLHLPINIHQEIASKMIHYVHIFIIYLIDFEMTRPFLYETCPALYLLDTTVFFISYVNNYIYIYGALICIHISSLSCYSTSIEHIYLNAQYNNICLFRHNN